MRKREGWVKVGDIGVDAGCIALIDPSYTLSKHNDTGLDIYAEAIRLTDEKKYGPEPIGSEDGFIIPCGMGDGTYDVLVRYGDTMLGRRVVEVKVVFVEEEADDDAEL